jgi:hypothetical protein
MIPMVGPVISMAGGIAGGILEKNEAEDQAAQAEKVRKEALGLKPDKLNKEFYQKLRKDQMSELAGLPGKQLWQQMLEQKTANDMRSIRESSPNGAAALASASAALGQENQALNTLAIKDSEFRQDAANTVGNDLWNLGLQKRGNEDRRDQWKREGLQAASALENAATANRMGGANKIIGSIGSTATALSSNAQGQSNNQQWMDFLKDYYMKNGQLPTSSTVGSGDTLQANNIWNYQPNFTTTG